MSPTERPRIEPTLGSAPEIRFERASLVFGADPAQKPERPKSRTLRSLLLLFLVLFLTPPAIVLALRWLPPPFTAFMLQSEVKPVQYQWVPMAKIADAAGKAVIASEDQKFYLHHGFDLDAIAEAQQYNATHRRVRGASTISQQVAKNLFLWPGRSWFRKGVEVTFTVLIETFWDKPRILETYLNIAEFGPGIYGVEAAARNFFHKTAAQLTPDEAARLASVLPNPRRWHADRPGPYVLAHSRWILGQMGYGAAPANEAEPAEPLESPENPEADDDSTAPAADASPAAAEPPQTQDAQSSPAPTAGDAADSQASPGDDEEAPQEPEPGTDRDAQPDFAGPRH